MTDTIFLDPDSALTQRDAQRELAEIWAAEAMQKEVEIDRLKKDLSDALDERNIKIAQSEYFEKLYLQKITEINLERKRASDLVDSLHGKIERLEEALDERDQHVDALLNALARFEDKIRDMRRSGSTPPDDTFVLAAEG